MATSNDVTYDNGGDWEKLKNHGMSSNEDVHNFASDTTGHKPTQAQMSDSLSNDYKRYKAAMESGDSKSATIIGKRADTNGKNYLMDIAKADSAKAAKAPQQLRDSFKRGDTDGGEVRLGLERDAKSAKTTGQYKRDVAKP